MADFQDFAGLSEFLEALKSVRKPPKAVHVNKQLKAMRPESLDVELLRQAKKINFMQRQAFGLKSDLKAFPGRNKKNSEEIQQNNQRLKTLEEKSAAFDANTTQIDIQKQFNVTINSLERFAADLDVEALLSTTEVGKNLKNILNYQQKLGEALHDGYDTKDAEMKVLTEELRKNIQTLNSQGVFNEQKLIRKLKLVDRF